jgi:HK97 gp10 family phage protein
MAVSTGVTVRVVSNRLPAMPALIRAGVIAEVQKATYGVEAKSKALAPVKTGTLRRSIHSVFENGGLTGLVGPSVLYGKFPEFGTRRMGAHPYMRPAAEAVLPGFVDEVKRALAGLK